MNEGLKKFEELMKNDAAFQEKLKAAMAGYTGEQTEQAVFDGVLVPLAKDYGISASYDEFQEYIRNLSNENRELSENEINQVAGGRKGGGWGIDLCAGAGIGFGSTNDSDCFAIGAGGGSGICMVEGQVMG